MDEEFFTDTESAPVAKKPVKRTKKQGQDDSFFYSGDEAVEGLPPCKRKNAMMAGPAARPLAVQQSCCPVSSTGQAVQHCAAGQPRPRVCLGGGSSALSSVAAVVASREATTEAETNGADPTEIRKRHRKAREICKCKSRDCIKAVPVKALVQICIMFWGLANDERGFLLRDAYQAAIGPKLNNDDDVEKNDDDMTHERCVWNIAGVDVCFKVFCCLLGTGPVTVRKQLQGRPDMRRSDVRGEQLMTAREQTQSPIVDVFFHHLYKSAAEPLPEDVHCREGDLSIDDLITQDYHQQAL